MHPPPPPLSLSPHPILPPLHRHCTFLNFLCTLCFLFLPILFHPCLYCLLLGSKEIYSIQLNCGGGRYYVLQYP